MKFKSNAQRKAVMSQYSQGINRTKSRIPKSTGLKNFGKVIGKRGKYPEYTPLSNDERNDVIMLDYARYLDTLGKKINNDTAKLNAYKRDDEYRKYLVEKIENNKKDFNKKVNDFSMYVKKKNKLKPNGDYDGDGVINKKDCQPFNPKKQGLLHDLNIKRLKAQEQKLENQRIKITKKLEDKLETLKIKKNIVDGKNKVKAVKMREKQAIINEIDKEKAKIKELTLANERAKKDLFNNSGVGKTINYSKKSIQKTKDYLKNPKTKKKINKFIKSVNQIFG